MWNKPPVADIYIDETSKYKKEITCTESNPDVIEFEHDLEDGKNYNLVIKRSVKNKSQTVIN